MLIIRNNIKTCIYNFCVLCPLECTKNGTKISDNIPSGIDVYKYTNLQNICIIIK